MSDLYNQMFEASWMLMPFFAFLIGAAGSLHCVGMCGGLAVVAGSKKSDPWFFNLGRLMGYFLLASLFSLFGAFFNDPEVKRWFTIFGGLIAGSFLIYIGIKSFKGKEPRFHIPAFERLYRWLFSRFYKAPVGKAFGLGLSSMLLPCALSNGFILAAISLAEGMGALPMIVFFWAGTLPVMIMGPQMARNLSRRQGFRAQKILGVLFVVGGVAALSAKIIHAWDVGLLCF